MTGQKELYDIFELIYPVGIIIELATNTNPKDLFGIGEWEQIKDRFILAAGDSTTAGSTGGASTHVHSTGSHTLTVNEIPSHKHNETLLNGDSTWYIGGGNWNTDAPERHPIFTGSYATTTTSFAFVSSNTGGGAAHNHGNTGSTSNMPPYYVAYLWRRVS